MAVLAVSLGPLPVFLLGALAVFIRADLGFGQAQLGAAVSAFFGVAAVTSMVAGRFVERIGWRRGLALGVAVSAVVMVSIAVAPAWWTVMALVASAGMAVAMCQLATNLALARGVMPERQGLAFGIKQAAVPVATLIAGLAVPLLGLGLGWRAAFLITGVVAAVVAIAFAVTGGDTADSGPAAPVYTGPFRRGPLLLLMAAAALGMGGGNALAAFYVDSAVTRGVTPGMAGLGLALGSGAAVVARVVWGWVVDFRPHRALAFTCLLLVAGAGGFLALAIGGTGPALLVATVVAFAAGWGWPGLLVFAIVRQYVANPAVATGYLLMGIYGGGTFGPLAFGTLVEVASYSVAWGAGMVALALAAMLVFFGRSVLTASDPYAPAGSVQER